MQQAVPVQVESNVRPSLPKNEASRNGWIFERKTSRKSLKTYDEIISKSYSLNLQSMEKDHSLNHCHGL